MVEIKVRLYRGLDDAVIAWWDGLPKRRRAEEVRRILRACVLGSPPADTPVAPPGEPPSRAESHHLAKDSDPPRPADSDQPSVPQPNPVLDTLFSQLESGFADESDNPWTD